MVLLEKSIFSYKHLSNANVEEFALISDSAFVVQNTSRIVRALFEIAWNRNWAQVSSTLLELCKCIDKRMWTFENPLAQFKMPREIIMKLQNNQHTSSLVDMRDMSSAELGQLVKNSMGAYISKYLDMFPMLKLEAQVAPNTRNIYEKQLEETQKIRFAIPIQLPPQLYIRVISDRWIGAEAFLSVSLNHLVLPENYQQHTELLSLPPLPVTALKNNHLKRYVLRNLLISTLYRLRC
ncbi:12718_t:CDS:2 [Funneliformis geosporum]|nr:12718_t:CDS:2 [Funneliformis geosporum]